MKQILTAKEEELMKVSFLKNKGFLTRRPLANTFLYQVAITEKEYRGSTDNNSFTSVTFIKEQRDNAYLRKGW